MHGSTGRRWKRASSDVPRQRFTLQRWFAALTDRQIRRGTHRSTRELESAIRSYMAIHNEQPKPFVWTKTADQILASLARFVTRISDSAH